LGSIAKWQNGEALRRTDAVKKKEVFKKENGNLCRISFYKIKYLLTNFVIRS
jgi:hypothetical protein